MVHTHSAKSLFQQSASSILLFHAFRQAAKAANVGLVAIMERASAGEWSFYKEACEESLA